MRNVRNRGLKHCGNTELSSVLVRGFRDIGENCGSDRWWASCHPRKWSCRTRWAHILCLLLTWPGGQTSRCRCGVAHGLRFQDGKVRQGRVDGIVSEVVVREWSRSDRARTARMSGTWAREKARWRETTHVQTPFYRHLSLACMCTRMKMCEDDCARAMCRKMCVQQVSVCTPPSYRLQSPLHVYELPKNMSEKKSTFITSWPFSSKKILQFVVWVRTPVKILRLHHSMSVLIFLAGTCSISWLSIIHCEWRLLGFPRHASLRDRPS